jgi:hypothetical protein
MAIPPTSQEIAMKTLSFMLGLFLATIVIPSHAQAQSNYPWCSVYSGGFDGASNCGFVSFEQCMENVRGIGGFCQQNNWYHPAAAAPQYSGRMHHHSQSE